jgi:hypothetical protein
MTFRIYLRDSQQRVTDKTVTGDPDAARAAFRALTERADLDGSGMLAVLNRDGRPVAHHLFATRQDGSPLDPAKWWRGRTADIDFAKTA